MEQRTQAKLLERLKTYRAQKKISHASLAKKLGISPGTLGQWLCQHRKLRLDECVRIEKLIGATPIPKETKNPTAGHPEEQENKKEPGASSGRIA